MLQGLLNRLTRFRTERAADRLIAEGNRAEQEGRPSEACEIYRRAVACDPRYARAHLNLGIGLEAAGDTDGAVRSYTAVLDLDPGDPYANYNLGKLLYARGALQDAGRRLRAALEHKPDFREARIVLSNVHDAEGNLPAAASELELVLKEAPDHPGALYNYGLVLSKLGRAAEAEAAIRRALAADPRNAHANHQLAIMLYARDLLEDAERLLRTALLSEPAFPEAHAALYDIYKKQDKTAAAAAELELVLKQRPDWADAWYDYGIMLKKLWRPGEAEIAFRRAVAIDPKHVPAQRMLGGVLLSQSRVAEALASYEEARKHNPDRMDLESAELFALLFADDISDDELFARHKASGARLEAAHPPRFAPYRNRREPERRLRIGYVSGDFAYHPVALFLIPLVERHDGSAFETYCYSVGNQPDQVTRQMPALVHQWREAAGMSAGGLADAINRDAIDILVDLSGHSGIPALETFALQPAPVQVTWLGYLNTTGMTRIRYRLCDRHTDPPGVAERFHTETLVRLPNSQWCYRPFIAQESPKEPPFERNGFVTFGSFNQLAKLSPSVRTLWVDILRRVPDSRLVVLGVPEGNARDRFLADMARRGIDSGRITAVSHVSMGEYFRWFNAVDIALDTTPYSGATTTCDTLWMGVPVITAPGSRSASRSTASILRTVGLEDWIAASPADYVRLAVERAGGLPTSAEPRPALRERMRASPMMDEARFARDIESAYRRMWRAWCERDQ